MAIGIHVVHCSARWRYVFSIFLPPFRKQWFFGANHPRQFTVVNRIHPFSMRFLPSPYNINRINERQTIDKYVNAYFSYRVATRRHSLIRPNRRSMTLRSLYRSESNGNDAPCSFALYGITASISCSARCWRISPDENALSPDAMSGRTGFPWESKMEIPDSTGIKNLLSCFCPATTVTDKPKTFRSPAMITFVVGPPRDRPMAWSSGSPFFLKAHRRRPCEHG